MNNDDFEKHRQALADKRLEKPKKLSSRTEKFWSEITSQQFNFERDEVEVEELGKITRDDLLAFYDRHIAKESPERRKLCSHVVSVVPDQEEDAASGSNANEGVEEEELQGTLIKDVVRFKASLPLHPLIGPYVDLETLKR
jgi:insulysin